MKNEINIVILVAFNMSFSVPSIYGSLAPFQSNEEFNILSGKSQLG